jgi:hypothetical protein
VTFLAAVSMPVFRQAVLLFVPWDSFAEQQVRL